MSTNRETVTPFPSGVTGGKRSNTSAPETDAGVELMQLLDRIEQIIPDYQQPDVLRLRRIRATAGFADQLVPQTISAVTNCQPIAKRNLFDVEAGTAALAYRDEFRPVVLRMSAIMTALSYSIDEKLATVATEALQLYGWAKRHARQSDGGGARPYVDEMQRVVERTINRRHKPRPPAGTLPTELPDDGPSPAEPGTGPDKERTPRS